MFDLTRPEIETECTQCSIHFFFSFSKLLLIVSQIVGNPDKYTNDNENNTQKVISEIPKHDRITLSQAQRYGVGGVGIPGPCPPSEDCAPKKLTGSRLLECKSRPKIPQLVFIALEFVSKNCVFVIFVNLRRISFKFWDEDLFFWSSLQISWKIARILRRQPEFVKILGRRPFFIFLVFTFFV